MWSVIVESGNQLKQSSAIITRSNIARYYINTGTPPEYQSDDGYIKDILYLAISDEPWVSLMNICQKINRAITVPHCSTLNGIYQRLKKGK